MKRIHALLAARWPGVLLQLTKAEAILDIVSRQPIEWDSGSSLFVDDDDDINHRTQLPGAPPTRYVKKCEISPSSPLTLHYWRATLLPSSPDGHYRIDRIITAMYLPYDVSFSLQYKKHTILLRGEHCVDLPTLLSQSRDVPTCYYSSLPILPVPQPALFDGSDTFDANGVTYRRRVPIYPFITCTMDREQFTMTPIDPTSKCDIYVEYANMCSETSTGPPSSRMKGLDTIVTEEFDVMFNAGIIYDIEPDPVMSSLLEYIYSKSKLMESIACDDIQ